MSLYFRLLWVILTARRRTIISVDNLQNEVNTIILLNDLGLNFTVKNNRYMTLCDFNRVDLFVRSGLATIMMKNKLKPMLADHTMTIIKPLKLFDRIRVTMKISHWDEQYFYSAHTFYRGDQLVAEGTSRSFVVSKAGGQLAPVQVLKLIDDHHKSRLAA